MQSKGLKIWQGCLIALCILQTVTAYEKDWFKKYFTRREVMEAGAEPVYDNHCKDSKDNFCATAMLLGDSSYTKDQFGSVHVPTIFRNQGWFQKRDIQILKYEMFGGKHLNSFKGNFGYFSNITGNITTQYFTNNTTMQFDNRFDYISVPEESLEDVLSKLNNAILTHSNKTNSTDLFEIRSTVSFDYSDFIAREVRILQKNGSCKGLVEELPFSPLSIHIDRHNFSMQADDLLIQESNGACTFAVSSFVNNGTAANKTDNKTGGQEVVNLIGKPFTKVFDVVFQYRPEGVVLVQPKNYIKEKTEEEKRKEAEWRKEIQKKEQERKKKVKPIHYNHLKMFEPAEKLLTKFGMDHSWLYKQMIKLEQSGTSGEILFFSSFAFVALASVEVAAGVIFVAYYGIKTMKESVGN